MRRVDREARTCAHCGRAFEALPSSAQKYCSKPCQNMGREVWRDCNQCGTAYRPKAAGGGKLYCSRLCASQAYRGFHHSEETKARVSALKKGVPNPAKRKPAVKRVCLGCGGEFQVPGKRSRKAESKNFCRIEWEQALAEMGIEALAQHKMGYHLVDFYLPALRTVIECNGCYWHACGPCGHEGNAGQRRRDKGKATWLANRDYRLVVLWEHEIRKVGALALLQERLTLLSISA